jgi:hypothetical protein
VVLALCGDYELAEYAPDRRTGVSFMGVDTGNQLHVVILRYTAGPATKPREESPLLPAGGSGSLPMRTTPRVLCK